MMILVNAGLIVVALTITFAPVFRRQRWRNDAEKLARRYDIALTEAIRPRVASLQRRQYVIGTVLLNALMVFWVIGLTRPLDAVTPREHAFAFVLTAMTFPLALLVCGFAVAWPAWNAPRGQRVTHAAPRSVWQAFTRAEWVALGLGVVVAVVSAGWGFLLVGAGGWWFAWLVAMVGYGGVWRLAAQAIMQRPSRASDPAELGWDDVLRYHETRNLTMAAAWLPALTLYMSDFALESSGDLIPLWVALAVGIGLSKVFKQGRSKWRESW